MEGGREGELRREVIPGPPYRPIFNLKISFVSSPLYTSNTYTHTHTPTPTPLHHHTLTHPSTPTHTYI